MTIAQRLSALSASPLMAVVYYSIVGYNEFAQTHSRIGTGIAGEVSRLAAIGRIPRTLAATPTDVQDLIWESDNNRRATRPNTCLIRRI